MLSGLNAGNQVSDARAATFRCHACFNAVRLERRKSGPAPGKVQAGQHCFNAVRLERRKSGRISWRRSAASKRASMLSGLNAGNQGRLVGAAIDERARASMLSGLNAGNQGQLRAASGTPLTPRFNAVRLERRKSGGWRASRARRTPRASMLSGLNAGNQGARRLAWGQRLMCFNAVRLERRKSGRIVGGLTVPKARLQCCPA